MDKSCKKILNKVVKHLDEDHETFRDEIKEDEELKKVAMPRRGRLKKAKGVKESKKMQEYGRGGKRNSSN